jgi:hypothetical protein
MSKTHKLGRSLPIAGAAALLVVGASFAHDSASPTSTAPSTTGEIRPGDDDIQVDALTGTESQDENAQGDEDDLAGKAEDDAAVADQDENDQADNEDQADDHVAPAAPKPAKTHKAKPATHVVASHEDDQGDDNDDQGEDGNHDGSHDGEHEDGGGEHDD